jgi:hypothetical protein
MLTQFCKQLKLPSLYCDLEANNLLCSWIDKTPAFGDVVKLVINKDDMAKHYRDFVHRKGEME